jgi:tetrahydromethanopterin S-methyltransferase subunit G
MTQHDNSIAVQLMRQLLEQNAQEFATVNEKLDRMEERVEVHDRDINFAKRVLKGIAAAIVTGIPFLFWLWP